MKRLYLNLKYFFKNFYYVFLKSEYKAYSFAGYGRHWLAKVYADKRTEASSPDSVTGRRRHYCFPYSSDIIMVCNRTEINKMKENKIISRKANIRYLLENATYISK